MTKIIKELPIINPEKIEKFSDINLFFIRRYGNYIQSSEEAWKAMAAFIEENHLDKSNIRYFSISHDDPQITDEEKLRFDACIQTQEKIPESKLNRQNLKGGKYAIFIHNGPHAKLQEAFDRIFLKWLPDSKDSFDDTRPAFCEHFNLEYVDADESKLVTKIFIPLI